jgi:hypothetical protein
MAPVEHAAAILQARMSWPEAEKCAEVLDRVGWTVTRAQAVSTLEQILPLARAETAIDDLIMYGPLQKES